METDAWCGRDISAVSLASHIQGKYLCSLVTKTTDKQNVNPESLVLVLTRLVSLPVYDSNRGKLHPRELYALVHVIFLAIDREVFLHKKYYLSIC